MVKSNVLEAKASLTDVAEQSIRRLIIEAGLKPGDKLPGELEMAERFNVSRAVIREALGRLRHLGVCESRRSRGLVLTEPQLFSGLEALLDLPVLSDENRFYLFQMRVMLEVGAAAFACELVREEDLDYLEELVEMEEADPSNLELAIDVDVKFHSRLYEMSGNLLVEEFQSVLRPFMQDYSCYFNPQRFDQAEVISHRDMLEVLKRGKADEFISLIRRHFNPFIEALKEAHMN